jgi:6-phosphogluconolactonase
MKLHISKDIEEMSDYAAGWIAGYIKEVLEKKDRFTIALSGGNTPKKLYRSLISHRYKDKIEWHKLHFFWGDERYVPFTDKRNNAKMAFDELLNHAPVIKEQIHIMKTGIDPESSAIEYQKLLRVFFQKQLYTFDLILLGLGDNAHTLSLFPGYDDIIFEKENWVRSFYLEEEDIHRITLTSPIVNNAGRIVFLVSGSDKADALQHVISGTHDPSRFPAQVIQPLNGELYWMVDTAASSGLQYVV